ncbi:Flagellin N-methylase [Aquisphaera giovannonii]|uniref:Flagellin N-methylase n=1 Tax=Aquisphaera giovannonii TaxID=406548 RepID=A0A5B9W0B9_9BACT|nr:YkgJ family cysteine cluster protein [Aquisphaera giovannonii]QEH33644.1 Flagellin N-methylase [Aquisphaera giovannonii]
MAKKTPKLPWYEDGLSFSCTRCGNCCTGAPGYVWVTPEEIEAISAIRGEPVDDFSRRFVRQVGTHYSLTERPGGDCILWDPAIGCTVYEARPVQCRTWPFWPENVESPGDWERVKKGCPGAGQGRHYSRSEIVESIGMVRQ